MSETVTVDAENIPEELRDRDQWLLWDASSDEKQPHWRGSYGISWSDPDDWHSFQDAHAAAQEVDSWGVGYVTAKDSDEFARGLYGVIDIDGGADDDGRPKDWVPSLQPFFDRDAYIEWSTSGTGLHIPVWGLDEPDWWSNSQLGDHEGVDLLTNMFCIFTGDVEEPAGETVVEHDGWVADWLAEAYENITGESPRGGADLEEFATDDRPGREFDGELTEEQVREALNHVDHSLHYNDWLRVGFAVYDWDSGQRGKRLFENWSRRSSKWNEKDGQPHINDIWENDSPKGDVTVGTLIHHARQGGFEFGSSSNDQKATTDGGTSTEPTSSGGGTEGTVSPETPDAAPSWKYVRTEYNEAEDNDDRLYARYEASELLLDEHDFVNVRESDELYVYRPEEGIYIDRGVREVREIVRNGLGGFFRHNEVSEMCEHIRAGTTRPFDDLGGPEFHIPVRNGVVKLDGTDRELDDHSPKYRFLHRAGAKFNPQADCPRWREFLEQSVHSGAERDKLQEYVGYSLYHWGLPFHKGLFIVGPKASGKSTFLDVVRELIGKEGVSSVTPQQMTERFGGAELFGKWANVRADIPSELIENTGEFKEIIAGDPIKAEKKHQDPFMFRPTAKHFYSANTLPDTEDDDDAFYRRILLVAFPSSVPPAEQDRKLNEKLLEELPGILNWALDGLQRLLDQGGFTNDRNTGATADTWSKWGSTVDRFASACLNVGADNQVSKREAYHRYIRFCEAENMPAEPQRVFTRRLKTEHKVTDGKAYFDGRQERAFLNIEFTSRGERYADDDRGDDRGGSSNGSSLDEF